MDGSIPRYIAISKSLLRVPTYLLLCLYVLLGLLAGLYYQPAAAGQPGLLLTAKLLAGWLAVAFWYMNGTALNDYADYEIDLVNLKGDKDRPLVIGLSHRDELKYLAYVFGLCALGLSLALSATHALITAGLLLLNYSYSLKPLQISRRGGLAPLLLPLGYVAYTLSVGYGLNGWTLTPGFWLLAAALYAHFVSRIILKDYRDVVGDAQHGKRTFLLRHGNLAVCLVSASAIGLSTVLFMAAVDLRFFVFPVVCLAGYAISILFHLSRRNQWQQQKPLLAAFGRAMTGVTVAVIMAFASWLWDFSPSQISLFGLVITAVYISSAISAHNYNQQRLQPAKR